MKILITGGAGFIGSHIAERLLKENCEAVALDNLYTGLKDNLPDKVKFVRMDIRDKGINALFEREKFDMVVHLAAQTMVDVSLRDPLFDAEDNIGGGINILEACRKNGVKRIIFASSAAVYGNIGIVPVKEEEKTAPTSFYGLSKLTFEHYLNLYKQNFRLDYVVLRFANVYGERQGNGGEGGVVGIFAKRIANGQGISIFGDGRQTRDFIYVGDITDGVWRALQTDKVNDVYNLSNKKETSINELVEIFKKVVKKDFPFKHDQPRPGDIYRSMLGNDKAVRNLNWQPTMPLTEGIERTLSYFANKMLVA